MANVFDLFNGIVAIIIQKKTHSGVFHLELISSSNPVRTLNRKFEYNKLSTSFWSNSSRHGYIAIRI